jgi:hypothetical protein
MNRIKAFTLAAFCVVAGGSVSWADDNSPATMDGAATAIPPETVITVANWAAIALYAGRDGERLLEGNYLWKVPPDIRIEVAPAELHPSVRRTDAAQSEILPPAVVRASTSTTDLGMSAVKTSWPSAVTSTSSSILIPMP